MKTLTLVLAAGAAALFATAASAAPLSVGPVAPDSNIQNVRMVCNEDGRCWREREIAFTQDASPHEVHLTVVTRSLRDGRIACAM